MKRRVLFALTVAALSAAAMAEAPPQHIDINGLPKGQGATLVDDVVVPQPNEIFAVLDKLGRPNWSEVLRPLKGVVKPPGGREQTALLLGAVIAEGFIAVEAENAEEVKNIGRSVLELSNALGVSKVVKTRSNAIIQGADHKDWRSVRKELDKAQHEVQEAMVQLNDAAISQLVSLGGWLRGTEALTAVVKRNYSKDGAELLHQPVLIDYFDRRIAAMPRKTKENPLVINMQHGLVELKPLMGTSDAVISEKTVNDISAIAERLIQFIQPKSNQ